MEQKLLNLFVFRVEKIIEKAVTPFYLAKQLKFSIWIRIGIYLALDFIFVPADLIHKILPDSKYTDAVSSLFTFILYLAIYMSPELKTVSKEVQEQ